MKKKEKKKEENISLPLNRSEVTSQGRLSYIILTNIPEISEAEYNESWLLTHTKPKPHASGCTAFLLTITRTLLTNDQGARIFLSHDSTTLKPFPSSHAYEEGKREKKGRGEKISLEI